MDGETTKKINSLLDAATTLLQVATAYIETKLDRPKLRMCQECNKNIQTTYETEWNTEVCGECWDDITNAAPRPPAAF